MKYHCGHYGCDVCGARECAGFELRNVGTCKVCGYCITKAVKFAIEAAETFSTYIDPAKPCGNKAAQRHATT
jgi:hypothetical protein